MEQTHAEDSECPVWKLGRSVVEDGLYREKSTGFGSDRSEFQSNFATLGN